MSAYAHLNGAIARTAGERARIASASSCVKARRCLRLSGTPFENWIPGRMRRM